MARGTSTDLSTTDDAALDVADQSYDALSQGADETTSRDIADKAELVGKPFIITRITFNPSTKGERDFVSCEITTKDNELLVMNDSSTGVRRDIVKYLNAKDVIDVGAGEESGASSRYDKNVADWDNTNEGDIRYDEQGHAHFSYEGIRLHCKKGLRKSDYRNEHGEGTTYYIA